MSDDDTLTFCDLKAFAIVNLRQTKKQFYRLSFKEFYALSVAYHNIIERQSREAWEQTRQICFYVLSPHVKKGMLSPGDIKTPYDMLDVSPEKEALTEAEKLEEIQKVKDFYKEQDNKQTTDAATDN